MARRRRAAVVGRSCRDAADLARALPAVRGCIAELGGGASAVRIADATEAARIAKLARAASGLTPRTAVRLAGIAASVGRRIGARVAGRGALAGVSFFAERCSRVALDSLLAAAGEHERHEERAHESDGRTLLQTTFVPRESVCSLRARGGHAPVYTRAEPASAVAFLSRRLAAHGARGGKVTTPRPGRSPPLPVASRARLGLRGPWRGSRGTRRRRSRRPSCPSSPCSSPRGTLRRAPR